MPNIIFCKNEDENIKVQRALFSVGIGWPFSGAKLINTNANFIIVHYDHLSFDNNFIYIAHYLIDKKCIALNSQDVIDNPMIVDGAKSQEKIITLSDGRGFSESTIKAALKQYINEK